MIRASRALTTRRVTGLPPLAWAATVRAGPVVDLVLGDLVETRDASFIAGAWDGPFSALEFLTAPTMMGTAGCVTVDEAMFCSATHLLELLYSVRVDDAVVVSNSLPLLFARTGDGPDLRYRRYRQDFVQLWWDGSAGVPARLPTRKGREVLVHGHANVAIDRDLSLRTTEKRVPPTPDDYGEYRSILSTTVHRLVENATDGSRRRSLRPVVTLSSGYDSTVGAVLGAEAGIRDAMTLVRGGSRADSGEAVGELLGLRVSVSSFDRWRDLSPAPEIEFVASVSGPSHVPLAALEDQWRGSLVLVGSLGDATWEAGESQLGHVPLSQPHGVIFPTRSMHDFALRAGIVFLHVPAIAGVHAKRIADISDSPEMRPWSTDAGYNRPIPRRIIEEAGVPRGSFARSKIAGASTQQGLTLGPSASADFDAFWTMARRSQTRARRLLWWIEVKLFVPLAWRTDVLLTRFHLDGRVRRRVRTWTYHQALPTTYRFHWAVTRLAERFNRALDAERID